MFKFDVYFRNIEVFNYFKLEEVYKLCCVYHTPHSLNIKIIKKLQLTMQKGAGCCMYPCDVISSVVVIVQSN